MKIKLAQATVFPGVGVRHPAGSVVEVPVSVAKDLLVKNKAYPVPEDSPPEDSETEDNG